MEGEEPILVHYGAAAPPTGRPTLWIRPSTFFSDDYGTSRSLPSLPAARIDGLPVLFTVDGEEPLLRRADRLIETTADFVASAFFLLSGYEETVDSTRDEHGRFPAARSFLGRAGMLAEPLVDRYAALLADLVAELAATRLCFPPWDGEGFALVLSHDVDSVRPPRRLPGRATTVADPILKVEASHGVRSTFFFIAGGEDPVRPRYELGDRKAQRALRAARRAGAEIALHGSYHCLDRSGALEAERDALQAAAKKPRGYRQHYLRLPPGGLARLERAGFRYDSSLGWADALGFRNGTARPFHPYDFRERRALRLVEIPLVVMDRTVEKHLELEPGAAWSALVRVLEAVRSAGGCAAVLWHPEFFDLLRHPGYDALYERTLGWLLDSGGRALTGKEAARAWKHWTKGNTHARA